MTTPTPRHGEVLRRAASAEAALEQERHKVRSPGLDDIARDEPWRVLRAADQVLRDNDYASCADNGHLRGIANHLEREQSERDRLVEKGRAAFKKASGINTTPTDGWIEAVVDAVLADKAVTR